MSKKSGNSTESKKKTTKPTLKSITSKFENLKRYIKRNPQHAALGLLAIVLAVVIIFMAFSGGSDQETMEQTDESTGTIQNADDLQKVIEDIESLEIEQDSRFDEFDDLVE